MFPTMLSTEVFRFLLRLISYPKSVTKQSPTVAKIFELRNCQCVIVELKRSDMQAFRSYYLVFSFSPLWIYMTSNNNLQHTQTLCTLDLTLMKGQQ